METIASRRSPVLRTLRTIARGRAPGDPRVLLDGVHLVEAARMAGLPISLAAFSSRRLQGPRQELTVLARALEESGTRVLEVPDTVMDVVSPVRSPSGVVAVAEHHQTTLDQALAPTPQLLIVTVGLQDPGNMGAVVRAVHAAGATAVLATGNSVDPFGWKALRGSMGSAFHLPVVRLVETSSVIEQCLTRGIQVLAAHPRAGRPLFEIDLTGPTAFVLGSEGAGLTEEFRRHINADISIPMSHGVESLNVAVAAALFAYEAFRQRHPTGQANATG